MRKPPAILSNEVIEHLKMLEAMRTQVAINLVAHMTGQPSFVRVAPLLDAEIVALNEPTVESYGWSGEVHGIG